MPRLTLAAATAAHSHLHTLLSHPQQITWDRLILYLDLLAHLERIDSKLTRTAQAYLASDEGLTREQEAVVTVYARDEEGRRKRRNTYVGWSLMLRRYVGPLPPITHHPLTHVSLPFAPRQYLNNLFITTHTTNPSARLTPLLESAVYRLLPPTGWEYPSPAPLFVRNIQGGEQSVVDKTDEAYEDVVVAYDEQGEWHPDALPHTKPLPEILAAIGRYVSSISTASRRLQRAFPNTPVPCGVVRNWNDTREVPMDEGRREQVGKSVSPPPRAAVVEPLSEQTIVLTTQPSAPTNGTSSLQSVGTSSYQTVRQSERAEQDGKASSRGKGKGKESRATRAVLKFFGDPDASEQKEKETEEQGNTSLEQADGGDGGGTKDMDVDRSRADGGSVEKALGTTTSARVEATISGQRYTSQDGVHVESLYAGSSRTRLAERDEPGTTHAESFVSSVDACTIKQHIIDERHLDPHIQPPASIPQRTASRPTPAPRRKHRSSMPGYDILLRRVRERSRQLSESPAPERARSVSVGPERTRRASMGPREVTPAPEVGSVVAWVPSPGSRFEVDEEGKLVYLGIAPRATVSTMPPVGNTTPAAPVQRIGTVESLRKVKEAAEATRTPPSVDVGSPASSRRREFVKPLPRVGNGSIPTEGEGNAVAGPSRIPVRAPAHTTSAPRRQENPIATSAHSNGPSRETATTTPTPTTGARKRPAPFEDSTVQRVPPQYRSAERRLSTSRAAIEFSRAQREGSGRR